MFRAGQSRPLVVVALMASLLLVGLFATYVFREAAVPQPRGVDGKVVPPLSDQAVPEPEVSPRPKRSSRKPKMSLESLERLDGRSLPNQNWDSVLTLARLSSEVYFDTRVQFALDSVGFDKAEPVDNGDRHSLVCSNSNVLVVVFRGTETITDKLLDIGLAPVRIGPREDECHVHAGFLLACQLLYEGIIREIKHQDGSTKRIVVTGHSLGGAMAVIFAYLAETTNGLSVESVVTFGQPLVANERFAGQLVQRFGVRHKRFVHRNDLVSRVARPYFHSGARILLVEDEPPRFWKPEILAQARPDAEPQDAPNCTTDQEVVPISEDQLKQVRDYAGADQAADESRKQLRRSQRMRKRGPPNEIRPTENPIGASAEAGLIDWISRGIDDHSMEHYIKCIEAQEVEADE